VAPSAADRLAALLDEAGERTVRLGRIVRAKGDRRVTFTGTLNLGG